MTSALPVSGRLSEAAGLSPLSETTTCADPRAAYRKLQEEWGLVAPVRLEPGVNAWLVMGYEEICQVVRHERVFSRDPHNWRDLADGIVPPDSGLGPMMFPRDNAYFKDGETHRRLRAPLEEAVSGLDQRRMSRQVKEICADLIVGLAPGGRADLVADYAAVIPALAVADNLTSAFVSHLNLHGHYEITQSIAGMISVGYETTTCWIAQALRLMLTDPRFAGRLRGGRLGMDDALDEVLWRDPPLANMPARFALRDTELAGRPILRGDALILALAAANADPRVHADDMGIEHGNRSHLAWSTGPHACPAYIPARIIARAAVETALHMLPDIRLAVPAGDIRLIPSPWTRCPASLPVIFSPTAPRAESHS
jgi:cytochrome P450